jgi:hypothetical protein
MNKNNYGYSAPLVLDNPATLRFGDNSTNASNFTLFVFSESH